MPFAYLDDARKCHAGLLEIVIHHRGGWADRRALRGIVELCEAAARAIDDPNCRENLRVITESAAHLFAETAHRKWDRVSLSGADFLRLEIVKALHSFSHRLTEIERARKTRQGS